MSNLFGNLTTDGIEESQDRLGGFSVFESDAYEGTIKAAYAGKSTTSKAQSVTLIVETARGEYRETLWITDGENKNYFIDKTDGKTRKPLPGFTVIDDLCLVTTNKPLAQQVTEDKVMNVYDPEQKKELPKSVPMLVELLGKKAIFGIVKSTRNKQKKNDAGKYVDTAETRDENSIDKVFHSPSQLTVPEARSGSQNATFYGAWVERNRGNTRDRRSIKDGEAQAGKSGRPGMPPQASQAAAKTNSLFGS